MLPVAIFILDIPPGALAGCGTYGYACTQSACFRAEISTNQGYTWQAGSAWVYGDPGTPIDLYVRTTLSSTVNLIEGWSLGLRHSAPTLIGIDGGDIYLKAATLATGANSAGTAQAGSAPQFESTKVWTCGQTQGLVIDIDSEPPHSTVGPCSGLASTVSCYRLTFPTNWQVHQITLDFTDDVGLPATKNLVVRSGQSIIPCKDKLTINVQRRSYSPTQSYCPFSTMSPGACQAQAGGGGGGVVECDDGTGDGVLNVASMIFGPGTVASFPIVASVRLWKGSQGAPPDQGASTWKDPIYDDSGWINVGSTPMGYPAQAFPLDDMQGQYSTFYVRINFTLPTPAASGFDEQIHDTWEADLGVDDGFVAFLNGREIRRTPNVGGDFLDGIDLSPDATTSGVATAVGTRFSAYADILLAPPPVPVPHPPLAHVINSPGSTNVLAVHVVNAATNDSDCVFSPMMFVRKRGPFVSRASVPPPSEAVDDPATDFEVVVRTYELNLTVSYTVDGGPVLTSDEVLREEEFNDDFGTVARIKVPGSLNGVPNPALPPGASVCYRVLIDGSKAFEDDLQLVTVPARFGAGFSFWAFGNSGLVGTAGMTAGCPVSCDPAVHQANLAAVLANDALPCDFALVAGDMVIRNNSYTSSTVSKAAIEPPLNVEAVDHRFYNPYAAAIGRMPFLVAPGDEDLEVLTEDADKPGIERDWDFSAAYVMPQAPYNEGADPTTEQWYSFDHGYAHFAVVRSFLYHEHDVHFAGQLAPHPAVSNFLRADLEACSFDHWKIVVLHHPPYTSSTTNLDEDGMEDDDEFRTALESFFGGFEDLGVDLVISAHEKFFEQTHAVRTTPEGQIEVVQQGPFFTNPGAPVYVITGGGGENLWQPQETNQPFTMVRLRTHHVTRITVGESVLTIQPYDENGAPIDINGPSAGTASTITKHPVFRRGDSNIDVQVDMSDVVFSLDALFKGGTQPRCLDAADANDDESFDLTDPIFSLNFLFQGGPPIPSPGFDGCGPDPAGTGLNCVEYPRGCTQCEDP
jgi:hypothetical protein